MRTFLRLLCGTIAWVAIATSGSAQTVLKFSHTDQPGGARQKAAELFAQKVDQYTQGRYKVRVYPAGQLANDPKAVEQLQLGGLDFTVSSTGTYAAHLPTLNLSLLPYLVDNYEQGWQLYDESKWFKAQFAKAPEKGFRFIATWEAGFRDVTTRKALRGPDDAKGKKLRSFPNEMMRWTLEAIGFNVQNLPLPEVYLALQQGVVSGQENPIDTIYTNKFYEVAPYVTLTHHVYSPIPLAISERTWQRLSPADRDMITKAGVEAAEWSRKEIRSNDERQLNEMEANGANIDRPEVTLFRQAVQPVYPKAREKYGADVDSLISDAEAVRSSTIAR